MGAFVTRLAFGALLESWTALTGKLVVRNACMFVAACVDSAFMKHTRARPLPPVIKLNLTEAMVRARPSLFFAYDARAFLPSIGRGSPLNVTFSSKAVEQAV
jgi:hypothetical protein